MKKVLLLLLCALVLGGCAVRRLNGWNDEDAITLTRELAADIVNSAWLRESADVRFPALLIFPLENRSEFHASLDHLEGSLARELLLSGQIRLVRSRKDAFLPADSLSAKAESFSWDESGADALLRGWLEVVPDPKLLIFRLTLEIEDAESGESLLRLEKTSSKPLWRNFESPA